jgi:PIN domain nuclease of toxin-antitoxin system
VSLLLDAHILLWWLAGDAALPEQAAIAIVEPTTEVLVSAATVWEIAIKRAAGRLEAPEDLLDALRANRFESLSVTAAHALSAASLPPHHTDPFDRMLVAQAKAEGLTLVTLDRRLADYEVELLPLGSPPA